MIFHSLNSAPDSAAFFDCCRMIGAGDALILLGDGVYAGLQNTTACARILTTGVELYVLEVDASAAGILQSLDERASVVCFDGFASLSERFTKQQAWY